MPKYLSLGARVLRPRIAARSQATTELGACASNCRDDCVNRYCARVSFRLHRLLYELLIVGRPTPG